MKSPHNQNAKVFDMELEIKSKHNRRLWPVDMGIWRLNYKRNTKYYFNSKEKESKCRGQSILSILTSKVCILDS